MSLAPLELALALAIVASPATAQSKSASKPKADSSAAAAAAEPSKELTSLQFAATELPEGVTPGDGVKCISIQAFNYFRDPGFLGARLPAPVGKVGQSFVRGKNTLGSVMAFEFAEPPSDDLRKFLTHFIWGEDHATRMHPEQILVSGRFVVILSFPLGDESEAWFETRVRERLAKLGPHDWSALRPLIEQSFAALTAGDSAKGLKLLQDRAAEIHDYAFAQYMLGELATAAKQWPLAEVAYGRAIELNDSGLDPLPNPPSILWASVDGLASALLFSDKLEQAVPAFQRGVELSRQMGDKGHTARSLYNYACSLSRAGRFEDSLVALRECIQLAPEHRVMAAQDTDFAAARARPDFRELLGS
ncbi:MAG TPA: tetratricopeptide repeat protein [Planctomycetota bacterium]|nr:tetratricopeptide repeat protein [Planctomycetota bacterium]